MKRFLPWLIAIGGLLLIAFVVRHLRTGGAATYQTANVARGQITQAVTATGTLNPVLTVQVGSQTFHRVRLGPYQSLDDANRIKTTLSQNEVGAAIIRTTDEPRNP